MVADLPGLFLMVVEFDAPLRAAASERRQGRLSCRGRLSGSMGPLSPALVPVGASGPQLMLALYARNPGVQYGQGGLGLCHGLVGLVGREPGCGECLPDGAKGLPMPVLSRMLPLREWSRAAVGACSGAVRGGDTGEPRGQSGEHGTNDSGPAAVEPLRALSVDAQARHPGGHGVRRGA